MHRLLQYLERHLARFAVPNLIQILVAGQAGLFCVSLFKPDVAHATLLVPEKLLAGQWWRAFSFLVAPPASPPAGGSLVWGVLMICLYWYFLLTMGGAMERQWGALRFNVYVLIGWAALLATSFFQPAAEVGSGFLFTSLFLAFAQLYPEFVIYVLFVLPVRMLWLGRLMWAGLIVELLLGSWRERLWVLAAISGFLAFFGGSVIARLRTGWVRAERGAETLARQSVPFHRCCVCGITDKSHPGTDFRYCSKCAGTCGYCPEHLRDHEHVVAAVEA